MSTPPALLQDRAARRKAVHLPDSRPNIHVRCLLDRLPLIHHVPYPLVHQNQKVRSCEAKSWWECRNFMGGLETHFSRYPNYFTRDRQLLLAKRYLAPELRDKWTLHCEDLLRVTWFDLCVFLANQLASIVPGSTARRLYANNYQKESQSVTEYAIWLQQFAPHFRSSGHNPMRHLYDRIRPVIKEHTADRNKGYDGFRDMTVFVEYLQSMEDSIPERIEQLSHRKNFPRK